MNSICIYRQLRTATTPFSTSRKQKLQYKQNNQYMIQIAKIVLIHDLMRMKLIVMPSIMQPMLLVSLLVVRHLGHSFDAAQVLYCT